MEADLQLKITLQGTNPPIWRCVLVDKKTTFGQLHLIIQIVMGWTNSHLYEFNMDGYRIAEPNEEFDSELDIETVDSATVDLDSIISGLKGQFEYIYDFGDSWSHQIVVEKTLPRGVHTRIPVCLDGKLNCPPEDCGGIHGFYNLLDILGNKRHPERRDLIEWLGGEYDKEYFNISDINAALALLVN